VHGGTQADHGMTAGEVLQGLACGATVANPLATLLRPIPTLLRQIQTLLRQIPTLLRHCPTCLRWILTTSPGTGAGRHSSSSRHVGCSREPRPRRRCHGCQPSRNVVAPNSNALAPDSNVVAPDCNVVVLHSNVPGLDSNEIIHHRSAATPSLLS